MFVYKLPDIFHNQLKTPYIYEIHALYFLFLIAIIVDNSHNLLYYMLIKRVDMDCLFCKIANGIIKTDFVYENENLVAFNDIKPQAPVHIVIIPRKHIATMQDIDIEKSPIVASLLNIIPHIARTKKIDKTGYRVVINCNKDGGQEIFHLHVHLMGGRRFLWPPG